MAMSAKLLQLVNSAFFGIDQRISSIERTVTLLGFVRIKALVLTEQIFRTFPPPHDLPELTMDRLWRHALRIAEMGRSISRLEKQTGDRPDQAFMAGLLHDIGLLVLASHQGQALEEMCCQAKASGQPLHALEKERWGVCHADVGAFLLQLWGLPPRIVEAVKAHHTPMDVAYNGICALTAVHVADALEGEVQRTRIPPGDDLFAGYLDQAYLERTGLASHVPVWMELARAIQARQWEQP
jgi:HD-like signal output (HDOD) protein